MAPPVLALLPTSPGPAALPLARLRPERVRLTPGDILKICEALFPLIVNWAAPGPAIVSDLAIAIWPLVRVIVALGARLNIIVSPELALATASLSDPMPLSAV